MPYCRLNGLLLDGWMDGYMDGWISGWMERWMDKQTDGWMYHTTPGCDYTVVITTRSEKKAYLIRDVLTKFKRNL